jgi:hypothetical protein
MLWVSSCVETAKFGAIMVVKLMLESADARLGLLHFRSSVKHISGNQVTYNVKRLCVQKRLKECR